MSITQCIRFCVSERFLSFERKDIVASKGKDKTSASTPAKAKAKAKTASSKTSPKKSAAKKTTKAAASKKVAAKKPAQKSKTAGGKAKKKFRFIVLGGGSKMAIPALREFSACDEITEVALADLNHDAMKALAVSLGKKFTAMETDANDRESLVESLRGFDVALGYIGPFYYFEEKIISACIEAKVHYVSIADDFDSYLSVEPFFDAAEKAKITVISGLGNSPGITNILSKKGYLSMDNPEKIHVQWTGGSDEEVGPANIKHVMHIFEGETMQWMDGKEVMVKTGRGEKIVEFPEPIGIQTVFYTGHAESVSIPRNLKGLKEVTLHGGIRPVWAARLATFFGDLGLTTTHKRRERLSRLLAPVMSLFTVGGSADKSVFRIDVYGSHKGKERHHFYTGVGHIAEITSMPMVEGALMVARGEMKKRGVFAAEAIIEPDKFLPRLAKRGVTMTYYEGVNEG